MIASFAGQVSRALSLADARRQRERRRLIEDRALIAAQLSEQAMRALLGISMTVHGLTARMQSPTAPGVSPTKRIVSTPYSGRCSGRSSG